MKFKSLFTILCLLIQLISIKNLSADVKLPKVLTDNMVLQRDQPVKIWGWADAGEKLTVVFNGQERMSKADRKGRWLVSLEPMKFGGPYEMRISGKKNSLVLGNILIGDVWLGSGQSNMEWKLINTDSAEQEIAQANFPKIRLFTVGRGTSFTVEEDLAGGSWEVCTPENVEEFSAIAYYFGKNLHQELEVPIGLINSSVGGSKIETWMDFEEIIQFEDYKDLNLEEQIKASEERRKNNLLYEEAMKNSKGMAEEWFRPTANFSGWKAMDLPATFDESEIGDTDGVLWFGKEFDLADSLAGKHALLSLGRIDDMDKTWVNGQLVGALGVRNVDRVYGLDCGVLKEGKNTIVIKVTDNGRNGGFTSEPAALYIQADHHKIPLAGEWKYKPSVLSKDYGVEYFNFNSFPSQLYNAMLAPLSNFSIKGVIWYQGESNTWNAFLYRDLFTGMITDWREKWGKDFPFLWVQLANYMEAPDQPGESQWADLREAQSMALKLPKTGQAVIIDIGEAGDIHPRNKKDVGHRLALAALKTTYHKEVVYSGPVYQSMNTEGNQINLSFGNTGSGLEARDKYGFLKGFSIAGEDRKFVWAKAHIEGDKVIVYSDQVKNPLAVRFAWADNPEDANLYNKEGLPASPFRTDTWETITQKKQSGQ